MRKSHHNGFAVFTVALIILLLGAVGFAGWTVYSNNKDSVSTVSQSGQNQPAVNNDAVESGSDIDVSVEKMDSVNLESDLDASALDEDIGAIL